MQVYSCRAISPKQIQHTWKEGQMIDREHDLLPGYVFLYSEEPFGQPQDIRRSLDRVIRGLRGTDLDYCLHDGDKQFAEMILSKNGIIGKTQVTETDGRFSIADESFKAVHTEIQKVDRRNKRMKIEMQISGRKVQTWVEYEIIQ
jgi:transcription antitermination factor NusG